MSYIRDKEKQNVVNNKATMIWSIADKLTGAYKPHEYGLVILPFTVLRRFDCTLKDKREAIQEKYAEYKDLPQELIIPVLQEVSGLKYYDLNPKGLRSVLENPKNVAGALHAFINNFSPNVREILEAMDINGQIDRLDSVSSSQTGLLYQVIDEFTQEKNDLSPDVISDIDMGYIFEEIIRRFSESYKEAAGQHYTPRDAIDLMVGILIREEDKNITKPTARTLLDPACGTGGMLSESMEYVHDINPKISLQCHGQEYNAETYAICRANLLIKDATFSNNSQIEHGDTLSDYKFKGRKFNYIISNPPFGREWKIEEREVRAEAADPEHGRFIYGLPSTSDSQMLFLSEAISAMESPFEGNMIGGRTTIIHNGSALFTGDAASGPSDIRRHLLENDLLDAIISLPENIFYNTGIGTYIWVLDNNKSEERKGKVQLIDGRQMFVPRRKSVGNKRVDIDEKAIEIITQAYHEYKNESYADGDRVCKSMIFDNSEFGYIKAAILAPELDENGKVVSSKKGKVSYDKSRSDTENIPLGKIQLKPGKDYLKDKDILAMVESYLEGEVRPFIPYAELDIKKTKVGFEIPFTRYFYEYIPPRPSAEIKEEIVELEKHLAELRDKLNL